MDEEKEVFRKAVRRLLNDILSFLDQNRTSDADGRMYKRVSTFMASLGEDMKPTIKQWLGFTDAYKKQSLNTPGLLEDISAALKRLIEIDEHPWRYCDKCKGEPDKLAHKMSCSFSKYGGTCHCPVSEDGRQKLMTMFDGALRQALSDVERLGKENGLKGAEVSILESKIRELEADNAGLHTQLEMETEAKAELAKDLKREEEDKAQQVRELTKQVEEHERGIANLSNDYGMLLNQFNNLQRAYEDLKSTHEALKGTYNRADAQRTNLEAFTAKLEKEKKQLEEELAAEREQLRQADEMIKLNARQADEDIEKLQDELAKEKAKNRNWSVEDEIQERLLANWHCSQCKAGICSAHKPVTLEEFMRLVMRDEARISNEARNNAGSEQHRTFVQALGFESLRLLLNRWRDLNPGK